MKPRSLFLSLILIFLITSMPAARPIQAAAPEDAPQGQPGGPAPVETPSPANFAPALSTPAPSGASAEQSAALDAVYVDGYGGNTFTGEDNMLLSYPSDATNINFGLHDVYDVSPIRRFIQRFNLSVIPADRTCISARVYYYKDREVHNRPVTVNIYSISQANGDWPEGNKDRFKAELGDSSWDYKDAGRGLRWAGSAGLSTAGVDYETPAIGTFTIPASAQNGLEFEAALDCDRVQGWFGASNTNYGILLIANDMAEYIGSAENTNPNFRPKLVVEYSGAAVTGTVTATNTRTPTSTVTTTPTTPPNYTDFQYISFVRR